MVRSVELERQASECNQQREPELNEIRKQCRAAGFELSAREQQVAQQSAQFEAQRLELEHAQAELQPRAEQLTAKAGELSRWEEELAAKDANLSHREEAIAKFQQTFAQMAAAFGGPADVLAADAASSDSRSHDDEFLQQWLSGSAAAAAELTAALQVSTPPIAAAPRGCRV